MENGLLYEKIEGRAPMLFGNITTKKNALASNISLQKSFGSDVNKLFCYVRFFLFGMLSVAKDLCE